MKYLLLLWLDSKVIIKFQGFIPLGANFFVLALKSQVIWKRKREIFFPLDFVISLFSIKILLFSFFRDRVNQKTLSRNIYVVADALSRHMYNLTNLGNFSLFTEALVGPFQLVKKKVLTTSNTTEIVII